MVQTVPGTAGNGLREYIYLKAHLIRGCLTALKKDLSKEEWNEFYLALGKQMEATPDYSYGATYDGLVEAPGYVRQEPGPAESHLCQTEHH